MTRKLLRIVTLTGIFFCADVRTHPSYSGSLMDTSPTDEQFVCRFLNDWLVQRNLDLARSYLAADFFLSAEYRKAEMWPPALRPASDRDRALRFPFACEGAPRACHDLESCIESPSREPGRFDIERMKVDADAIASNPGLRSREGRDMVVITFKLKGCNIGAALMIDQRAPDNRRVVTMIYLAG